MYSLFCGKRSKKISDKDRLLPKKVRNNMTLKYFIDTVRYSTLTDEDREYFTKKIEDPCFITKDTGRAIDMINRNQLSDDEKEELISIIVNIRITGACRLVNL